jgi:exodeoxyribonuclease-3
MKIATWNINGIKARLETVVTWLKEADPDIACFQEIKSIDENFPGERFEELGYHVETHGQKSFNGVAILTKSRPEEVLRRLPGNDDDEQARYMEVLSVVGERAVRVGCLYLPNGNPLGSEKFTYKLGWMERLIAHARERLAEEIPFVLAGDYNVIPQREDAKRPDAWRQDALFQPESRAAYRRLVNLGLTDAVRSGMTGEDVFTFWDYQAGAWQKNDGIRIDHVLLSAQATDLLQEVGIDRHARGWEKPSDHVPVWIELDVGEAASA